MRKLPKEFEWAYQPLPVDDSWLQALKPGDRLKKIWLKTVLFDSDQNPYLPNYKLLLHVGGDWYLNVQSGLVIREDKGDRWALTAPPPIQAGLFPKTGRTSLNYDRLWIVPEDWQPIQPG